MVKYRSPDGIPLRAEDSDWREIAAIVHDAYRMVAPARLVAQLDDGR